MEKSLLSELRPRNLSTIDMNIFEDAREVHPSSRLFDCLMLVAVMPR